MHCLHLCHRLNFENERGLDRLECRVTQYWREDEGVIPVVQVARNAAAILEHILAQTALIVVGVNVSGKLIIKHTLSPCT